MSVKDRFVRLSAALGHSKRAISVLLYEWVDPAGNGIVSSRDWTTEEKAKFDQKVDRILELKDLKNSSIQGLICPFDGNIKKIKINGKTALRPLLVLGPEGAPEELRNEITFLHVAQEKDRKLLPSPASVKQTAKDRREEIRSDPKRRKRYEQD